MTNDPGTNLSIKNGVNTLQTEFIWQRYSCSKIFCPISIDNTGKMN